MSDSYEAIYDKKLFDQMTPVEKLAAQMFEVEKRIDESSCKDPILDECCEQINLLDGVHSNVISQSIRCKVYLGLECGPDSIIAAYKLDDSNV